MPLLLFLNIKGGVAKTTTAVGVAEAFANLGRRVLVIDADHQCASSELLLGEHRFLSADKGKKTLHDLLAAMLKPDFNAPQDFVQYVTPGGSTIDPLTKRVSVIPCSFRINDFVRNRAKAKKESDPAVFKKTWTSHQSAFRTWLSKTYDVTIVDCPPSLALQVDFLLGISDGFVVPSVPDRISIRGARWLLEELEKRGFKKPALGVVWTLFRQQVAGHKTLAAVVTKSAGKPGPWVRVPKPFKSIVPNASAIVTANEAWKSHKSLAEKYTHEFANLFEDLAEEIETQAFIAMGKSSK